jgi:opacity protein-like surface antigen
MILRSVFFLAALLFSASSVFAAPLSLWNTPTVAEDPRSLALGGAVTTIGTAWTALNHNPAGINQTRQYVSSMGYGGGGEPKNHGFSFAATDSLMNPAVSLGFGYTRLVLGSGTDESDGGGDIYRAAMVFSERSEGMGFHLGVSAHYSDLDLPSGDEPSETSDTKNPATTLSIFNINVGVLLVLAQKFRIGLLGRNLLDRLNSGQSRDLVGGLGLVLGPAALEYSATMDFETCDKYPEFCVKGARATVSHAAGLEFMPSLNVPFRVGYRYNAMHDVHVVSGGLGFITREFALEGAYARELTDNAQQWFGVTFRYFPNIPGT